MDEQGFDLLGMMAVFMPVTRHIGELFQRAWYDQKVHCGGRDVYIWAIGKPGDCVFHCRPAADAVSVTG